MKKLFLLFFISALPLTLALGDESSTNYHGPLHYKYWENKDKNNTFPSNNKATQQQPVVNSKTNAATAPSSNVKNNSQNSLNNAPNKTLNNSNKTLNNSNNSNSSNSSKTASPSEIPNSPHYDHSAPI